MRLSTYPFEKFFKAVTSMAIDERPMPTRLISAYRTVSMVQDGDFKNPDTLAEFKKLREMLMKVQDPERGSVAATCAAMSFDEAYEAAEQFVKVLTLLVTDGE